MAAETALKLVLLGQDKSASKTLRGVGNEAGRTGGKLGKLGGLGKAAMFGIAGAALAGGAAAIKFGGDSIKAFADAQKSQAKLTDAYARFPKVANVNIDALRKYNQTLQRKTGADADDIAAGQASLAGFKLTGKQIKSMTPLLVDYAAKTGKSLPDAAKVLGKATMGSGKALKELGINFKDAKDPAKNLQQIMDGLKAKVGGYAESLPEAEKKGKILAASFGDLQESVGEKLQPALIGLTDAGQSVLDWMDANPEVMEGVTAAGSLLGDMFSGLWDIIKTFIIPVLAQVVLAFGNTTKGIAGMLHALGSVPGFEWAETAADKLDTTADGIFKVVDGMNALSKEKPKVDIDDKATKKVAAIDKKVADLKKKKIKLAAEGDTKGVDRLAKKIHDLEKKKHQLKVDAHVVKTGIKGIRIRDIARGNIKISAYASGIKSAPAGMAWVGDAGPELLQLPAGSRVRSNGQSRALANQGGTGGGGQTVIASFSGRAAPPKEFAKYIELELYKLWRGQGRKFRWDR